MKNLSSLIAAGLAFACFAPDAAAQKEVTVYVGTYTRQNSKGIYAWRFQPSSGKLTSIGLVAETSNPSFLAVHPNRRYLYAVNEDNNFQGKPGGGVSAFAIDDKSGQLKLINQVSSGGPGPCHLALDKTGKWLFVANYGGGSVSAYPVHPDGSLGEASAFVQHKGASVNPRQRGPHAHSANLSPDNKFVLFADLGLDEVLTYRIDSAGKLPPADPPFSKVQPGSGPRHMAFHPKGKFAYACNEIAATVTVFAYDSSNGSLKELQTISMVPEGYAGAKGAAEIAVHPSGKFVYASNRDTANGGKDTIAVFAVDPAKGTLTPVEYTPVGKIPRNFAIDPSGKYLFEANQEGASVLLYRIDPKTGKLTSTGDKLDVPLPVCVVFR
jgi:6-phosphogluconolactonase